MSDGSVQAASQAQPITRELGIGEIVSKTFDIYRKNLFKFVIIYIILEAILGTATTLVDRSISVVNPVTSTAAGSTINLGGFFGSVVTLVGVTFLIAIVFYPIELGAAIKMTSDEVERGETSLMDSVKYMVGRLVWFWIAAIVVGIILFVGLILLIIPGIVFALWFSMVPPVIVLEKASAFASLGRSRRLVAGRLGKTFVLAIVIGIIVIIPVIIFDLIARLAGPVSTIVGDALAGLILPVIPIALTIYYYSNVARTAPPQQTAPVSFGTIPVTGVRYCPNCGVQLPATATFCPNCGAKQDI